MSVAQSSNALLVSNEFNTCQDLTSFLHQVQLLQPEEAFNVLMLPLSQSEHGVNFENIRRELYYLIKNKELQLDIFLENLLSFSHLTKYDLMISTLLTMYNYLPESWPLRQELALHITHALGAKYILNYPLAFSQNNFRRMLTSYGNPIGYLFGNAQNNKMAIASGAQKKLNYEKSTVIKNSEKYTQNTKITTTKAQKNCEKKSLIQVLSEILPSQPIEQKLGVGPGNVQELTELLKNLLNILPKPTNPYEARRHNIVQNFLRSEIAIKIATSLNLSKYNNQTQILDILIRFVLQNFNEFEVQQAFRFYSLYKEASAVGLFYSTLVQFIPRATNDQELLLYITLKDLFESKEIYTYLKDFQFESKGPLQNTFVIVLSKLSSMNIFSPLKTQAINHYYSVILAQKAGFNYTTLINVLPKPSSEAELVQYKILQDFLSSKDVYQVMADVDITKIENQKELLKIVLGRVINQSDSPTLIQISKDILNFLISQTYGFNYLNLLAYLPTPQNDKDNTMYKLLEKYFYSPEINKIWSKVMVSSCTSRSEMLEMVLQNIYEATTSVEIKESVSFYLAQSRQMVFTQRIKKLASLLSAPQNDGETAFYQTLTGFLQSEQAYNYLQNIDLSMVTDDQQLLLLVLKTLVESKVSVEVLNAAKFYLEQSEKLAPIELITKKEIQKSFKLTDIFMDTFDMASLQLEQKNIFRKFFTYIAGIKRDIVEEFDSWDQAKTRGEFIKLLFQFLGKNSKVPDDVKAYIVVLDPLVKMDGKAALPP